MCATKIHIQHEFLKLDAQSVQVKINESAEMENIGKCLDQQKIDANAYKLIIPKDMGIVVFSVKKKK